MIAERVQNTCVIGLFWGDEGKGKVVDLLTDQAEVVVRYNGGANAGHTVVIDGERFALHLVPSGLLHPGKTGVLGPGVALDPEVLLEEIGMLKTRGINLDNRLRVSKRCHVVMPYHKLEDQLSEAALHANDRIGTTARGIGPCYADKMRRSTALRFCDLFNPAEFTQRLQRICEHKQTLFEAMYKHAEAIDYQAMAQQYLEHAERLRPYLCDTTTLLRKTIERREQLLFEGAHGTLLDIDHGTYPYVTSSSSCALGVPSGSGVAPAAVHRYLGVVKAYTTRVGQGPFPTQLDDAIGDRIREQGNEYGTTTGRPRRCGWFDAVAARYGVSLGGINEIAVMHLDTLTGIDPVRICTAYEHNGESLTEFPAEVDVLESVTATYETLSGWSEDITKVKSFGDLPQAARDYIIRLEQLVGADVSIVSVGPDRNQTIIRGR